MPGRISELAPWFQPWAKWLIANSRGAQLTSTWRSPQQQLTLYLAARRGESKYPAAPPGHSMHEQRRAFDIIAPLAELQRLGALWESVGGRWGGRFGDPIHFEA